MLARSALRNPTVFCKKGIITGDKYIPEFLKLAAQYDLPSHLIKYTLQQLVSHWRVHNHETHDDSNNELVETRQKWMDAAVSSINIVEMLPIYGFSDDFIKIYSEKHAKLCDMWREKADGDNVVCIAVDDDAKTFMTGGGNSPKDLLLAFCKRRKLSEPVYETTERLDREFSSFVLINDKRYTSGRIEKRKKVSEQTAALAALVYLDAFT